MPRQTHEIPPAGHPVRERGMARSTSAAQGDRRAGASSDGADGTRTRRARFAAGRPHPSVAKVVERHAEARCWSDQHVGLCRPSIRARQAASAPERGENQELPRRVAHVGAAPRLRDRPVDYLLRRV